MELGPRDIISRAMITEFEAGNGYQGQYGDYMHLDVRHLGEKTINTKLPFMRELMLEYMGIDIVKEPMPVRPVEHYMMGGIHADASGATPIAGLYAAGECANVGLNGANRLGSNSLTECLVFGAAAGRAASRYAQEAKAPTANPIAGLLADETKRIESAFLTDRRQGKERIGPLRTELQQLMDRNVGVFRTKEGLQDAVRGIAELRRRFFEAQLDDSSRTFNTELVSALELDFMLEVAETMAASALAREESRGAHSRRDFPEREDGRYLKHTLAHRQPEGPPKLEYLDVTLGRFEPQARTY
jgi:fumarate reductase flavoprotein subunit